MESIINVIKICGIDISTIFHLVFRYLPFFLTVLRYWVTPNVPLLNGGVRYNEFNDLTNKFRQSLGTSLNRGSTVLCLKGHNKGPTI